MGNKRIERYILKNFLLSIVFTLSGIVFIYIIVDFFEMIGIYIDRKVHFLKLVVYYLFFSPSLMILVLPLVFLLSVYFSLGRLTKNNEILAMNSLGISPLQIYKPIFFYSFILYIFFAIFNSYVVPFSTHKKSQWWRKEILGSEYSPSAYRYRNVSMITESGWHLYVENIYKNEMSNIDLIKIKDGKVKKRIIAKKGVYNEKWEFQEVYIREFKDDEEDFKSYPVYYPDFLKEKPEEIVKRRETPEEMNSLILYKYIKSMTKKGFPMEKETIELFLRFTYTMISLILLLYGCPLAVEAKKRGLSYGLGWGLFISFFFWGIVQYFRALGLKGVISPFISSFLPIIIFFIIGIIIMILKQR
uniref:YjgP/YjgQ family permease n=1 Tax=candidate division WOR-3 bacterium TaxID=2052148 RepID=A0A7C4U693_UNCW3